MTPPGTPVPGASAPQASFDPLVGATLVDRYQIIRKIGEGGMGAVYEARHTVLDKRVAVKVLLDKFLEKPELVARLLQEARMASSIGHENIVDVTDFGQTSDNRAFVVMEFLEGESLATLVMRDAPLPVERSLRVVRQAVSALGAAHDKGIVHRDVKPENVYIVRRGEMDFVKVVDFGVSKAVRSREDGAEMQRLTHTGMVLGTPLYMSPEQARGLEDIDHRTDIWSAGVLLYECLTGEVPFRASNYLGVISQVLTRDAPPPSKLRPELGIPRGVETVVMRALEKDRDRRYQRMEDLERDIDRLLAGDENVGLAPEAPVVPVVARGGGARWHLGVAAVLAMGVGVAFALARSEGTARSGRAAVRSPPAAAVVAPQTATPAAPSAVTGSPKSIVARTATLPSNPAPPSAPKEEFAAHKAHPPRKPPSRPQASSTSGSVPAPLPEPGGIRSSESDKPPPNPHSPARTESR